MVKCCFKGCRSESFGGCQITFHRIQNDAIPSVRGLRQVGAPLVRGPFIRDALERANFQFHRVCSSHALTAGDSVIGRFFSADMIRAMETQTRTDAEAEGAVGVDNTVTANNADVEEASGVPLVGERSSAQPRAPVRVVERRQMRSTSQQTLISCRCSPESVCDAADAPAAAGVATLPSSSILGSVCALLLCKRGRGCATEPEPDSVKDTGSAGSRRSEQICRICFGAESSERLVRPCSCRGTIAAVHRTCLEHWLQQAASSYCELCRHHYLVTRTHKLSWARSALAWATSGRGRALAADALRGAAMTATSVLGTSRALQLCDRILYAAARRGGGAALAANVFSSLLIGIIGALNGLLTTWVLLKIQEHRMSWQSWRDSSLHVHVTLDEDNTRIDAATSPPSLTPVSPPPAAVDRSTNVADPFMVARPEG